MKKIEIKPVTQVPEVKREGMWAVIDNLRNNLSSGMRAREQAEAASLASLINSAASFAEISEDDLEDHAKNIAALLNPEYTKNELLKSLSPAREEAFEAWWLTKVESNIEAGQKILKALKQVAEGKKVDQTDALVDEVKALSQPENYLFNMTAHLIGNSKAIENLTRWWRENISA